MHGAAPSGGGVLAASYKPTPITDRRNCAHLQTLQIFYWPQSSIQNAADCGSEAGRRLVRCSKSADLSRVHRFRPIETHVGHVPAALCLFRC
jgi:hypothetical protein